MRKSISLLLLAGALTSTAAMADSSRAVLGGALGGAAGAAIGYNVNGRDGALVGAALGGLVGVAASTRHDGYYRDNGYYRGSSYYRYEEPRVIRREVYVERPRYYYPPERVVYVPRGHYDRGWHERRWEDRHDRWEHRGRWD